MPTIDMSKLVKLQALDTLAQKADAKITAVETKADNAFKGAKVVNGNTIAFYKSTDTSGTADLTLDLPAEMVLDATKTSFVSNFNFASGNYTGATDPNLDGKAVLVLAIKTTDKAVEGTSYSFVDVDYLVDTYTAADNSINVNGYTIAVKISAVANNAITLQSDGLHVDISGKQDKDTDAVLNNIAKFDANGNAVDAGIAAADVLTTDNIASDSDVVSALSTYFVLA